MYIYGGWNSNAQFNDLCIFDIETLTWQQIDSNYGVPRWNHSCCAVEAIPNWKMFIFGGCSGVLDDKTNAQGTYVNDVAVLDTGSNFWAVPEVHGEAPKPRADTEFAYDAKGSRLIVFGGWANRWFSDVHVLDVGSVVGPPYAIMGIEPKFGPVTGKSIVRIEGIDFVDRPCLVRFAARKGVVDMPGTFVSDVEITCEAPNFEKFGVGMVDVRVSLGGDSFTTTFQKYTFFAVTDASRCLALGPGVLNGCCTGVPTVFYIQACDNDGVARVSGGDEFTVLVRNRDDASKVDVVVTDGDDGRYRVEYTAETAGQYEVSAQFEGTFEGLAGHIRGSPFVVAFENGVNRDRNKMEGSAVADSLRKALLDMNKFMKATMIGMQAKVSEDNVQTLLSVMEQLHNVGTRKEEIDLSLDQVRFTLDFLAKDGSNVGRQMDQLAAIEQQWSDVQEAVAPTKQRILPLVKTHAGKTQGEIQAFEGEILAYQEQFKQNEFWEFATGPEAARRAIDEAEVAHEAQTKTVGVVNHKAQMFDFPEGMSKVAAVMAAITKDIAASRILWDVSDQCLTYFEECKGMLWSEIEADAMEEEAKVLLKKVKGTPKTLKWCTAYTATEQEVKNFLNTTPLLVQLHHQAMRPRHWTALAEVTKIENFVPPYKDPNLLLGGLLQMGLHDFADQVDEITDQAQKEAKMESNLDALDETWANVEFVQTPYKESHPGLMIISIGEEEFEQLENDQLTVQGMLGSRFLSTFEKAVVGWSHALGSVSEVTTVLTDIQRMWGSLEPLLIGSDEVKRELPEDAKRFAKIDKDVKEVLALACRVGNIKEVCTQAGLFGKLEGIQERLEICKKSLKDFLAGKQQQFPRFYFMSEADLLDILSTGSNPHNIMRHITKVFLAVKSITLEGGNGGGDRPVATRWTSGVGIEEVDFSDPVPLEGKVEIYLQTILDALSGTLEQYLGRSLERYPTQPRTEWLLHLGDDDEPVDPAQLALLVSQIDYTNEVDTAFEGIRMGQQDAMNLYQEKQLAQLADLVRLTGGVLNKRDRRRVMAMITMDAHSRDTIDRFVRLGLDQRTCFQWMSQLKNFMVRGKAVHKICDAQFNYGYEYLGNGSRLIVTPLTDRIYVTATQALNLKMGCAPAGPAGTGKTETTKDLACALGKTCYVVNCAPEMDYLSMGDIFKGLAASGSWGCFDEFNRLIPEVLSVCSVQFKAVCDGIKANQSTVVIESDEVNLDHSCGVFITMNPGYLGRSDLPEGLKALFRPMTVMVPDLVMIAENMMMAEGFLESKNLARKFYGLYSLLGELLSKQPHYDWGLRAVKSVLVVAGTFKRAEPDIPEDAILMRALRDFNVPKIVRVDDPIFYGLLKDLFPGINPPRAIDEDREAAALESCGALGLWPDETFRLKVVQLEELLENRHCVFIMGPAGAGKSQCWKTLAHSKTSRGLKTKVKDLNPKAVSPQELYGYINMATREWKDGVLSVVMRDLGEETNNVPEEGNNKWIVLDGDLDANWIESMNSVMDDNRMLTLASNERIPLKQHMRMLFEIRDLKFATPATVSRAGILYISSDEGSQWRSLVASWVQKQDQLPAPAKEAVSVLFNEYIEQVLDWLKKNCQALVPASDLNMVNSLLVMLSGLMASMPSSYEGKDDDSPDKFRKLLEPLFVFAAIWAFGSSLQIKDGENYRKMFSDYWRSNWKNVKVPSRETVFDYFLDPKTGRFDTWKNSSNFYPIEYDSRTTPMSSVTVPTPETASIDYWTTMLVDQQQPVMLVGYAGCGKTQFINGFLRSRDQSTFTFQTMNFNFYTNTNLLQATMEAPLEKKTGNTYGPKGTSKMIYFLDDLNLPEVDEYGTQSAIALLRQHIDYGQWYDRDKLALKKITNCQYVSCMNHTVGSFVVNPRLQRHFTTFGIGLPGAASLLTIYQTFLDGHLSNFDLAVKGLSSALIKAALGLHSSVSGKFKKTAKNFHYEFNVRHLSGVFQGLLNSNPDQFSNPAKMVTLWLHESERVYGDRLVSLDDVSAYREIAAQQAKKHFASYSMSRFFLPMKADPLIFCHYAEGIEDKIYDQVEDMNKLTDISVAALEDHNETNATMNLVLFEDAIKHTARIARIILNPSGHALLVGVGGSGKQSLSRLASFICGYVVRQVQISATYGMSDLKTDLQEMYRKAGTKNEGTTFLFTDQQIVNERFLVLMNDLLASGNIPDLFPTEDVDDIVNSLSAKVKAAGLVPDRNVCWDYFIREVRRNLHVVLCFSPMDPNFRNRCMKFPALVNSTVIDWFQDWPHEALMKVGQKFLAKVDLGSENTRDAVEEFMPYSFSTVQDAAAEFGRKEHRRVYSTPKSYLELLKLYASLLESKRQGSSQAIKRLSDGLTRLRDTAKTVGALEEEVIVALAAAEEKKTKSEEIAEVVGREKAIVDEETAKATEEAAKSALIQEEVTKIQTSAQQDLDEAEPLVAKAMSALDSLTKKDLGECKGASVLPPGVDDVFAAVMTLLAGIDKNIVVTKSGKVKDKSWEVAKKTMMTNVNSFLQTLQEFKNVVDRFEVPKINWKEVRQYLELPHFNVESIENKNKVAGGLVSWVINIVIYYDTITGVEPKRQALAAANERLEAANAKLKVVQDRVAILTSKLKILTDDFDLANKTKEEAVASCARMQRKLDLAQRLVKALASENVRWAENVETMTNSAKLLIGDTLIASAFISYIGPFTKPYRAELVKVKWVPFLKEKGGNGGNGGAPPAAPTETKGEDGEETKGEGAGAVVGFPMSEDSDPMKILTSEAEVALWNSQTLPSDQVSTENGTIVTNSSRWPLLIDPQLQGISWIREKESKRHLEIVRLGQKGLMKKLESAMEGGLSFLIENMGEHVDATLMPVIARQAKKKGNRLYITLGEKEVELHPEFKLFLHTKLSNPHYPPEMQAECTLVNFTVTEQGLEDQLLSLVVRKERDDLAEQSARIIQQDNEFKVKVVELEDQILYKLATAEGEIAEDLELIEGLEDAKRVSNDIKDKMAEAATTKVMIDETSEKFRPVATRGALLFFLMNEMFRVHSYYMYSLNAFVAIFNRGIDLVSDAPPAEKKTLMQKMGEKAAAAKAGGDGEDKGRFNWNNDQLGAARRPSTRDIGSLATSAKKATMTDDEMAARCTEIMTSIQSVAFGYVRRGLFEEDKLTVATLLALRIEVRAGTLNQEECDLLILGRMSPEAGGMGPLAEWMSEAAFARAKALETVTAFQRLGDDMQSSDDDWHEWFDTEKPEVAPLPGAYAELDTFHKILLLRALRPDRLPAELSMWVSGSLGAEYVNQPAFDMQATYNESSPSTPIFFTLFPGVDPTTDVETLGKKLGMTAENGKFLNIAMGQGQETLAETSIQKFALDGGWIMLQNVHLMQTWLPQLERSLESAAEHASAGFRCFISAEPPPIPSMKYIPESLLQSCIKVMNENPSDVKSNLRRAWANFSQERLDGCSKPEDFRACLFTLSFFHSLVLGRRKFGQQGWSRKYSFNTGDLLICANVLESYIENNPVVPWDDLRYIFAEIMYGGHITDWWDRRTNTTYLQALLQPAIFEQCDLIPCYDALDKNDNPMPALFPSPDQVSMNYEKYTNYIEEKLPAEAPVLFGMHPNSEIGYLTQYCDSIFTTILTLNGNSGGGGAGGESMVAVKQTLEMLKTQLPESFELIGLSQRAELMLEEVQAPYVLVAKQECTRMNKLLDEMRRALSELEKGLNGQLNMSEPMEDLATALAINQVPGRNPFSKCSWEKLAWWSKKSLFPWFNDLRQRVMQLEAWEKDLTMPFCIWYPGLFNPMSFNTAIMQVTARETKQALDQMTTETHITYVMWWWGWGFSVCVYLIYIYKLEYGSLCVCISYTYINWSI